MADERERGTSIHRESRFRGVVIAGAIAACAAFFYLRFGYELTLPALPPKPPDALERARAAADRLGRSDRAYRESIRRDAKEFGAATEPSEMERAFLHHADEPGVTLEPQGDLSSIDAAGLRLAIEVEPVPGSHREQMVLSIESLLDRPAAYRVLTRPSAGERTCRHKRSLPHDAIAIAPGAIERRSECTYERGWGLEIHRVETVEIPELSYYYVSQLRPRDIRLPERTSAAHRPASGAPCDLFLSARVTNALDEGSLRWLDAVDFYARHDCKRFTIPADYTAFRQDQDHRLPVVGAAR